VDGQLARSMVMVRGYLREAIRVIAQVMLGKETARGGSVECSNDSLEFHQGLGCIVM